MKTIHPIKSYQWLVPLFRFRYFRQVSIDEGSEKLEAILEKHPRFVCVVNHGPMLAPLAIIPSLIHLMIEAGGGDRKVLAIVWRPFYKIPLFKHFAAYVTNTATALSMSACLKRYNEGFNDIVVMPEGDFCLFGDGKNVGAFISPKFVELAIKIQAPILIGAHQGTQAWGKPIAVPRFITPLLKPVLSQRYLQQLQETQQVNMPKFPWPLKGLRFTFKLYEPTLTLVELSKIKNSRHKEQRLKEEAEKIQQIMQAMAKTVS